MNRDLPPIAEAMKKLEWEIHRPRTPKERQAERERDNMREKIRRNAALLDCIPEVLLTLAAIAGGSGAEAEKAKAALKPVAEAIDVGFFTDI